MNRKRPSPSDEATQANDSSSASTSSSSSPPASAAAASSSSPAAALDSTPAPAGSVLPSRFLPAVLRMMMQDLDRELFSSIPFMPTPLVDLIASYAAEDDASEQAVAVCLDHVSLEDVRVQSAVGPNCAQKIADSFGHDVDAEYESITTLAALYARLDMPEVAAWKVEQGLNPANDDTVEQQMEGWTPAQQGDAATRMARMLVAASKAPPASVHPALAAVVTQYPFVLASIRVRTARLRGSPAHALALWADDQANGSGCAYLTSFSSVCTRTGQAKLSVLTHDGSARARTPEEEAAEARAAASTPPQYVLRSRRYR